MMEKLAALALALLMTLSLAACGDRDDQAGRHRDPGVTDDAVPDMGTVGGGTYATVLPASAAPWMTAGISTPMSRSTSSTASSARAPATRS